MLALCVGSYRNVFVTDRASRTRYANLQDLEPLAVQGEEHLEGRGGGSNSSSSGGGGVGRLILADFSLSSTLVSV